MKDPTPHAIYLNSPNRIYPFYALKLNHRRADKVKGEDSSACHINRINKWWYYATAGTHSAATLPQRHLHGEKSKVLKFGIKNNVELSIRESIQV